MSGALSFVNAIQTQPVITARKKSEPARSVLYGVSQFTGWPRV
jgi:hypothetical protein